MTDLNELPPAVCGYLDAHGIRDADAALACFTADATVTDEGHTHRGLAEIRTWLATVASEYTYTTERTGVRCVDDARWIVTQHLEGNFPGGVVDLHFDFTLRDGKIAQLVIAP